MEKMELKGGEFVLKISALWHEQKRREFLYLLALKKEKMGPLRKMLSHGHFSAMLFQREIQSLYDYFKCFLNDKDLDDSFVIEEVAETTLHRLEETEHVAGYLKTMESKILNSYRGLHRYIERDSETRRVFDAHLNRISEFYEILSRLEGVKSTDMKLI